jgi:hypothetical protein
MTRLRKIAEEYVDGNVCRQDIAARHGISPSQVIQDLRYVRAILADRTIREVKEWADIIISGHLKDLRELEVAWLRSQMNREKIRTEYKWRKCESCKGTGFTGGEESGDWCSECNGEGSIQYEETTKQVEGQAGDAGIKEVMRKTRNDIARLTGLAEDKKAYDTNKETVRININNVSSEDMERFLDQFDVIQRAGAIDTKGERV